MDKELPKFIFAESPEIPGAGLIIGTQRPCYVIKVFKFTKPEEFDRFMLKSPESVQVTGYMLAVQYYATIGEKDPIFDEEDVKICLNQAAEFYLKERILVNEKYYKRFLI